MPNMSLKKNEMPVQDPNVRNKNFKEVTLGYTAEMAINEAKRCLQCKKPHCVEGCPVNIHTILTLTFSKFPQRLLNHLALPRIFLYNFLCFSLNQALRHQT